MGGCHQLAGSFVGPAGPAGPIKQLLPHLCASQLSTSGPLKKLSLCCRGNGITLAV